jgi:hypothetical protein
LGLTLVDGRESRVWHAPRAGTPPAEGGGGESGEPGSGQGDPGPDALTEATRSAAAWIADQVGKGESAPALTLCLDHDGARCSWLTAAGADDRSVAAAVAIAAEGSSVDDDPSAGPGFGAVWAPEHGEAGSDMSVQALAVAAPRRAKGEPKSGGGSDGAAARRRLAVLAVPDLAARLLIDELDKLGVRVEAVTSVWHCAAQAWDPARAEELTAGAMARAGRAKEASEGLNGGPAGVLSAGPEQVTAVVVIDPSGRLVWSWSRGGALIAAGGQRLRRVADKPPVADEPGASGLAVSRADGAAEPARAAPAEAPAAVVEVSRSDTGRVIGEWLAWSVQTGVAPTRVVCVGPANVVCAGLSDDLPGAMGVGAVGSTLARDWPGAAGAGVVEDDPLGATLARLANAGPLSAGPPRATADPRVVLTALASRPGRAARGAYRWIAAALLVLAGLIGVLAWRVDRAAAEATAGLEGLRAARAEKVRAVKDLVPRAADPAELDPAGLLRSKVRDLLRRADAITPEKPILPTLVTILESIKAVPGAQFVGNVKLGVLEARFDVAVGENGDEGPRVLTELTNRTGKGPGSGVTWSGKPSTRGAAGQRIYEITGQWSKPERKAAAGADAGAAGGEGARP